jgi:hypothetical protein
MVSATGQFICDSKKAFGKKCASSLFKSAVFLLFSGVLFVQAGNLNEWTFETDPAGRMLSQANNSGTSIPPAQFSTGGSNTVFTTNRILTCIGEDPGSSGSWTNGVLLDAAVTTVTSGVFYLRYDFEYDFNSTNNNSGTVLGLSFVDTSGSKFAGMFLDYSLGSETNLSSNVSAVLASDMSLIGKVSVIARIDLNAGLLNAWYDLTGMNHFAESAPDATNVPVTLRSIQGLRFQATGDFHPADSDDYAAVDNIRHASTWADITAPIPDFSKGPAVEIVSVTVTNPGGTAGTEIGQTNTVKVVIRNLNAPASNLISSVSAATHPEYFTITSNNAPVVLTYSQYVTNTFSLVANTNSVSGPYTFDVQVTADSGMSTNTTFSLTVGSQISYRTNSIVEVTNLFTGVANGRYESGETLDITVFSTNNGALSVSNAVNSLYADPACFTISNRTSSTYPSMPVGAATSTVYRVTINPVVTNGTYWFSVTNRAGSKVWSDSFSLEIFSRSVPSLSHDSLSITTVAGQVAQKQVVVSNTGNKELNFTVSDNAVWGSIAYVDTAAAISTRVAATNTIPLVGPTSAQAFSSGESDTIDIGFPFPFYGTNYTKLYVDSNGAIIFSASNRINNTAWADSSSGDLPRGNRPLIAPLRHVNLQISDASPVRYVLKSNPTRLVIVHSNVTLSATTPGTNLYFQTELFTNGQIKISYYNINGSGISNAAVGFQGSATSYTNFNLIPASGKAVVTDLSENRWVTYASSSGTVPALGSTAVIFTVNGAGQTNGTVNAFTAVFNWDSGASSNVAVSASVVTAVPLLAVPSSISFSGNAGEITSTTMILSNAGTAELNFTITDTNISAISYQSVISSNTAWTDISGSPTLTMLDPHESLYITASNEGFSALQPIGFEFPFYGNVYTQFSAGVNGGISLGITNRMSADSDFKTSRGDVPQQFITPYWGNLLLDTNASIRWRSTTNELVVTWKNVEQQGVIPGTDLTFQTVLYIGGRIEFRYQQINGSRWPITKWGVRSSVSNSTSGVLILMGDANVTTNEYGYLKTNYVSTISGRTVSLTSSNYPVITCIPSHGTIPVGGTADVTINGDAGGVTPGGANNITNTAALAIVYENGINSVGVTFMVTNSVETQMVRASALDEDSDGMSYDAELIAGTDPLIASSVFAVSAVLTDSGRILSWLSAAGRTYTVWYTLDLTKNFVPLEGASGLSGNTFTDTLHSDAAVIYYKVTVD